MGFLQLLPVNALGRDECPSPYSAISSIALEPLYLSLEPWTVPGLEERVFNETGDTPPWEQPSGPDLVDYPKVRSWKMWILRGAWHNFRTKPEYAGIMPKFREWVKEQGSWLEDFVCFQVLCDLFGTAIWWHWPEQDPARAKAIAADYEEEKDFSRWLQWLCEKQWEFIRIYADERNVKLMGDIPIGVSLSSSDVFFERHLFNTDWCGGAPAEGNYAADPFTAKWGQNWGIPLYKWDVMAQDNFAWWRRRVKYCTKIFSMYRIDHILGFYRIYAFPWKPTENDVFLPLTREQARRKNRRPPARLQAARRRPGVGTQHESGGRGLVPAPCAVRRPRRQRGGGRPGLRAGLRAPEHAPARYSRLQDSPLGDQAGRLHHPGQGISRMLFRSIRHA